MASDFDHVRDRVGIDKLDESQRDQLFKKFVDSGGEVVKQKPKSREDTPPLPPEDRRKPARTAGGPGPSARSKEGGPSERPAGGKPTPKSVSKTPKKKKKPFAVLKVNMKGMVLKTLTLSGGVSDKFIALLKGIIKTDFIRLKSGAGSFIKGAGSIKKDLIQHSKKELPLYELIFRLHALYNEKEFAQIEKALARKALPTGDHMDPFKNLFRKIYVLGQFKELCKLSIRKAAEIQDKKGRMKETNAEAVYNELREYIDLILIDFLNKLHIVICRIAGDYLPLYTQKLDDFIGMTELDRIGSITREEKKRRLEQLKKMKEYLQKEQTPGAIQSEDVKIPRHVQRGLPILNEAIERYEKTRGMDEKDPLKPIDRTDKMYKTALLLDVFDREYSFILTTGKIEFNVEYREQKKIDIKEDLGRAYSMLSEARHEVTDYIERMQEMRKTENNPRLTINQKSSMLDSIQKKRALLSRSSRKRTADIMKTTSQILSTVIDDYKESKRLLLNPDERLTFNEKIDGVKKMDNKKIIEAVVETFLFTSTFSFLLNYGELTGSGLTVEGAGKENPAPA